MRRKSFDYRPRPRRAVRRTPGATYADIDAYIAATGDTEAAIAEHCRTTQGYVSRIRRGQHVPRTRLAARIAKYCGIPIGSFAMKWLAVNGATPKRLRRSA